MLRIVFPEGDDPRVREAAEFLEAEGFAETMLLTGADDIKEAANLVKDEAADAVLASVPVKSKVDSSFVLLEREGKNGRPEKLILTDLKSINNLDTEKLLDVQPRVSTFPYSDEVATNLRKQHPLWLVGDMADLDDVNILVAPDAAARDMLGVMLRQFTSFRAYGPISRGSDMLSASFSAQATTADIISTAFYVDLLHRPLKENGKEPGISR